MISFKTQNIDFSFDINELLCEIEVRLSSMAKDKMNSERFGTRCKIDVDRFFILSTYRKILQDKANKTCCLRQYSLDDIINHIKQYLTLGRVTKIKGTKSLSAGGTLSVIPGQDQVVVNIIHKYGDSNVYNSTSNRFVTEISQPVQDSWDQTDW